MNACSALVSLAGTVAGGCCPLPGAVLPGGVGVDDGGPGDGCGGTDTPGMVADECAGDVEPVDGGGDVDGEPEAAGAPALLDGGDAPVTPGMAADPAGPLAPAVAAGAPAGGCFGGGAVALPVEAGGEAEAGAEPEIPGTAAEPEDGPDAAGPEPAGAVPGMAAAGAAGLPAGA